jgi:AraC-like DNA-binding protein
LACANAQNALTCYNGRMRDALNEIARLADKATTVPTVTELPGVLIIKGEVPEHQLAAVYQPMIGFVVQGGKTISIGGDVIDLKAPAYFVVPTNLPATGRVHQGSNGLPYLSVGLRLNHDALVDLLKDLPRNLCNEKDSPRFSACPATTDFLDSWLRMLRLLKNPEHIPALGPVYEREILYRVLLGPQGWRLRQICSSGGKGSGIRQAIQWIRENYGKTIDVKRIAAKAAMGITTFHRRFKQITGLSPVQFQKQLRLLQARKLLAFSGHSVSDAAYTVGYESPSQFNREYSRFFGAPPARDASRLRQSA